MTAAAASSIPREVEVAVAADGFTVARTQLTAEEIDRLLAAAVAGAAVRWPGENPGDRVLGLVVERVTYHGIAGLLVACAAFDHWPEPIAAAVQRLAVAQSMWELRHQAVLRELLGRLAAAAVPAVLLKGTAAAYDIYENPAARARADTDLLIKETDRSAARALLGQLGFCLVREDLPEDLRSEENWLFHAGDGSAHYVDLHWRPLNAPGLNHCLTTEECLAATRPLPRLAEGARAPGRPLMLLHACLHRSLHMSSPYFVGSQTYFSGDRLIWLNDIAALGRSLSHEEWQAFSASAVEKRVANACLGGIHSAEARFGTFCPEDVRIRLAKGPASAYVRSGQLRRAMLDALAIEGARRRWRYVRARMLPGRDFMRQKYPQLGSVPLPLLHLRRFIDLLRARP